MPTPIVSYVIAAYNHEEFIERSIRSVLNQTERNIELIVIDDGSSDATYTRAVTACEADSRATVRSIAHRGVVAARNIGVEQATAPFVSIIDSDDTIPPYRTQNLLSAFSCEKVVLAYGNALIIDAHDSLLGTFWDSYPPVERQFSPALFSTYCFVPAVSVMFRKSAFADSGPFWGNGRNTDYLKWIELGLRGDVVRFDSQPLGSWRLHRSNTSKSFSQHGSSQYDDLARDLRILLERNPSLLEKLSPKIVDKRISRCSMMAGVQALFDRNWDEAARNFRNAYELFHSPLYLIARAGCAPYIRYVSAAILEVLIAVKAPIYNLHESTRN